YAYTKSPEIHSGDEHFRIEAYTQPIRVPARMDLGKPWTTLQVFPFDAGKMRSERAMREIEKAIRKLGMRTLIFLRNISEMGWCLDGGTTGIIRRSQGSRPTSTLRQVEVSEECGGLTDGAEWLIFHRPVAVPSEFSGGDLSKATVDIEIAY